MSNLKIGLGTVQFGTMYGISNTTGQTSIGEVEKILHTALDKGIQVIDTASAYGKAEEILGNYDLTRFKIVSKFIPVIKKNTITNQLQDSLSKLHLNSIHAYLAHRPMSLTEDTNQWNELQNLKEMGKVKKIGFSLNSPGELELLLKKKMIPDLVQVPYNYFDNRFRNYMIQLKGIGCEIHTRSTFLQGLFFMNPHNLPPFFDEVKSAITNLQLKYKSDLANVLLKYVTSFEFIDHVIIGVESEAQLIDSLRQNNSTQKLSQYNKTISELILMPSNWPVN